MRYLTASMLESAVGAPQPSGEGEDVWPDIHHKAAALMRSLAENQPLLQGQQADGNDGRLRLLRLQRHVLRADDSDLIHLLFDIAIDKLPVTKIADYLAAWAEEIPET